MRFAILFTTLLSTSVFAQEYNVKYGATFLGLPVGAAEIDMTISGKNYIVNGSGKIKGVAAMFAGGSATIKGTGTLGENRLHGRSLITAVKGKHSEVFNLELANDAMTKFTVTPHKDQNPSVVPLKEEHKRNIYDPLSAAFVFAKSPETALTPETCQRTYPVLSGRLRYDATLTYIRTEQVETNGYVGKALVCEGKITLIAGYRTDKNVEIDNAKRPVTYWLVPVKNSKMMVVYRADVKTKFGSASIEAETMKIGY